MADCSIRVYKSLAAYTLETPNSVVAMAATATTALTPLCNIQLY